jgi:hypothetical protein
LFALSTPYQKSFNKCGVSIIRAAAAAAAAACQAFELSCFITFLVPFVFLTPFGRILDVRFRV